MEATRAQKVNFWWSTTQFTVCTVFMINFLYFSLRYKHRLQELEENDALCCAKCHVNHPIKVTANTDLKDVTNVGEEFFIIFIAGIVLNALSSIFSIVACYVPYSRKRTCLYTMQALVFITNLAFTIIVTMIRFSHAG